MIIDTHSHCYWDSLQPKIAEVIRHMRDKDIERAVQIGCTLESSREAIVLARKYPEIFLATVGFHPEEAQNLGFIESDPLLHEYESLIREHRAHIVAIGECGFDFHYLDGTDDGAKKIDRDALSPRAKEQIQNQKDWWRAQWILAKKYDLPLVIHTRDARDETLDFMRQERITRAVMHCFSEDPDFASVLMEFSDDIYFSFSGILTYKNSLKVQETARMLPLERILVETDAPFLAPQCVRGQTCEPAFTRYTLEKLIELRSESGDVIENQVYENSKLFYGI